jgi:general secretion pathway protein I
VIVADVHAPPRSRARGFTLIEVLAALVIVGLGMLGVIEAVTQAARNGTYLREKTLAHWIAMNLITERRLAGSPPAVAETSGEVDYAGQQWRWTLRVTQTQVPSLRRMDVSVRAATAAEGTALATASGFYGEAVGAAGGGVLAWAGSRAPGSGGQDGDNASPEPEPEPPPGLPTDEME